MKFNLTSALQIVLQGAGTLALVFTLFILRDLRDRVVRLEDIFLRRADRNSGREVA